MTIPFIDLQSQRARISEQIDACIQRVLEHGKFILGPEVTEFEQALAGFENAAAVVACANGTDAIVLALRGLDIGAGDAVFCPSYTYTATAEAIILTGATPVFVDINPADYCLSAASLETAIDDVTREGALTPKAVIAVDLFGHPADYPEISKLTRQHGLTLISDNAQSIGCRIGGKSTAEFADITTTSFFPAKPLGCYGDGGAVLLKDKALESRLRSLAFHGRSDEPFDHDKIGFNSRLDTIQAAILIEKLKIFGDEIKARNRVADRYAKNLGDIIKRVPKSAPGCTATWAQYAIEVDNRDAFLAHIRGQGLPVAAYYPRPVHEQSAYVNCPVVSSGLTETNRVKKFAAALPMHAYLSEDDQDRMIDAVKGWYQT
ncbi:MAG: DegT/DnrJ/EryC1/StrS aminotransferase family protein [Hellea sp.]|nr:DegT/DnrJ/EryC1/StrS aminotransferase family protein [Hellea sp.]